MRQNNLLFGSNTVIKGSNSISNKYVMVILVFCLFFGLVKPQASINAAPVQTTINANTVYQFIIVNGLLNTVTNTSAVIEITFPSSFFSLNTGQTYSCFNTDTPSQTYSCRATTTNVIQINNPLVGSVVGKISVSTIKNPGSQEQVTFSYVFKYSNGTIISQATSDLFRSYTPGSLQSCSVSFNPSTVHTTTQITVTVALGNQVQKNGSIYVNFPTSWTYAANSSFPPIISTATQVCTLKSGSAFLNSGLNCSIIGQIIVIDKCFNNTAPSGTSLSFSITNILSPPTIFNGYSITVTTLTDSYKSIDQTSCTVNQVSSRSISGINLPTQLTVGSITGYTFEFNAPTPIAANDRLTIQAVSPNDVYFSLSAGSSIVLNNALVLTIDSSNSSALTLAFPSVMSTYATNTKISIIQGLLMQPLIGSGVRSLTLTLKRNGFDYATQSFSVTIFPNTLVSTSITLNTYTVSTVASYTFSMNLANLLAAKSKIVIKLPNQLSISNGVCTASLSALSSPSSVNSSFTCGVSVNRVITLSSINTNTLQKGEKLTITISGILNSQTTKPTDAFSIYTYYGETTTNPTDSSLDQTVTMSAITIGVASVSSSSPRVGQSAVYTFSYTVRSKFMSNSKIKIGLPSDIVFSTSLSAVFSITYSNATTTAEQSCILSNYTLNSVEFLQLSSISSLDLVAGTIITMKVSSLVNPSSLKPSASFSLYQVDSNGYDVQKLQTGLIITNSQTNAFSVLYAVESTVRMNGESAIYTLNLKSSIDLAVNDYLQISMGNAGSKNGQIYFSNTVTSCDITYDLNGVSTKLSTTFQKRSPQLLKININELMPNSRTYQIAINTIDRARTQQTPNDITVSSFKYISSSLAYGMSSSTFTPSVTNKKNTIQSVSLNIITSPSQLFSYQSFAVTVVPKIQLTSGDFVVIDIPRLYLFTGTILTVTSSTNLLAIANQSLCVQSSYFCSHYVSDMHRIKVQQLSTLFSSTKTLTVTIKNNLYLSPSTFSYTGYYFKAATYASNTFGIDETVTSGTPVTDLVNAQFYVTCKNSLSTYHCKTCLANNTCSACYQTVNYNGTDYTFDGYKFLTSDGKCVSVCGTGYFISIANNICTKCDSPCNTCQTTSTTCLSCLQNITTNKYHAVNNTCLSDCPNGFYTDAGNICQACSGTCSTCLGDSIICTSCPSTTFLNTVTNTCVSSTSCPFGTFADTTLNKCSPCDVSCSGCASLARNCSSCATGYIIDTAITAYKACTNRCPTGTVNDTVNNLGCRCQTQCLTCQTTVSTCTSCSSTSIYKYFYSNTCLVACPQSTYSSQSISGNMICVDCAQSNCRTCDSSICSQCIGTHNLYQGICMQTCPTATVLAIQNGIRKCTSCMVGCLNCDIGPNICTTCDAGYLKQSGTNGTYCTAGCSSRYVNFNNTVCYTSCPDGYENINQVCSMKKDNTTAAAVVPSQLSSTRRVPFPFIIASAIFLVIIILSKIVLPESLVSTLLTSIIGVLQPFSWIVAIVVCIIQTSGGKHWDFCSKGVFLLIAALIINVILNIIAMVFFCKYIRKDTKFNQMLNYNEKKVFLGKCPSITVMAMAVISSHKVFQVLFSNFLLSKHFSYKLQTITHMVPLNYVLFCSTLPSILAIAGGSLISYELQSYTTESSAFIAALDTILITLVGLIVSLWVTNRKNEDYEKQIGPNQLQKHYQTQQILVEGNCDDNSQNLNEVFMQKSGIRRQAAKGNKNYFYQNSRISQRVQSHDNEPLTKRQNNLKPINESNRQRIRASNNFSDQHSSQALVINEMQRRRNLKDEFFSQNSDDKEGDLQIIDLQKTKNKSDLMNGVPLITKIHYPNNQKKQKPQQLLKMTSEQKMLLKKKIESQLSPQQKEKLGILNKEKQLKIKKKKQKIEQILKIDDKETEKLSIQEKNKVSKVKQAVDVLKRKEIKIEEYLLYAQIIKEEQGQYDEESQQQISEINQKAHTIIKGIQDDDQDLQEVIKLSPKRQRAEGRQNMGKSQSKDKISQLQADGLKRSQSKDRNSLSKDKKQTSKQKTIKKDTTNKKDRKNQRRNKTKPPNDLQVNYNIDQNNNQQNDLSRDDSFGSQPEPELPKTRSNIVGKIKSKNRSEKQINSKKTTQPGDLMMIDVGSNRHNRTQNEISGQLQLERADTLPPNHLRSTQKVQYKKKHLFDNVNDGDRNQFDSENDRETMKSFENDIDFQNDILPTQFKVKNKKFDYVDQSLDMPVKPKILTQNHSNENDITMEKKTNNITKHDGFDIYEGDELQNQINYNDQSKIDMNMNHTHNMSRYSSSNVLNYDSMLRKNMQNEKLKQLQKIYLPRLDPKANKKSKTKRQLSLSKINSSKL